MNLQTLLQQSQDELLAQLGVSGLSEADKAEVAGKLVEHLQRVILETMIVSLNDEQVEVFRSAWEAQGEDLEQQMSDLAASVPGLADKIQAAVHHELDILKESYGRVRG